LGASGICRYSQAFSSRGEKWSRPKPKHLCNYNYFVIIKDCKQWAEAMNPYFSKQENEYLVERIDPDKVPLFKYCNSDPK